MKITKSYKVGREGVIIGVFDEPEMVYMVSCGKVIATDDYWTEGMTTWAKVSSRPVWSVSVSDDSPAASLVPCSVPPAFPSDSTSARPANNSGAVPRTSFFSIWWKTALVIYIGSVCLGYLNSGEYGFGYMLGQGLVTAPLSALFFGGIIYGFSKNTGPDRTKAADHSEIVREFNRGKVFKK